MLNKSWCESLIAKTDPSVTEKAESLNVIEESEGTFRVDDYTLKVSQDDKPKMNCSCNYWRWQGPEYWATQEGYLLGKPKGTASKPNVKDPKGNHFLCKHAVAVLRHLTNTQKAPISKRASMVKRVVNSYLSGD